MPGVVRLGDICTGHGCFPPRSNVSASGNVIVNGLGAHRVGDNWASHCCVTCHDSIHIVYALLRFPPANRWKCHCTRNQSDQE